MQLNVFIRELVVHDTSDPGDSPGEYDVAFAVTTAPYAPVSGAAGAPRPIGEAERAVAQESEGGDAWSGLGAGPGGEGTLGGLLVTPRWKGTVRRGETYEVLAWIGPVEVDARAMLVVAGRGIEHDPIGTDTLLGGVAHLAENERWGVGRWWRTGNGKHFDFLFAVAPAEEGHAGRPPLTGQHGEIQHAPGPNEVAVEDYPQGLE